MTRKLPVVPTFLSNPTPPPSSQPQLTQTPPPVPPKQTFSKPTPASVSSHAEPFIDFISSNPTTFHTVAHFADRLSSHGFTKLSERDLWSDKLKRGGKYYVERNGSSLLAFVVGDKYEAGNGAAVVATHVDALAARVKPIPKLETKGGYVQLGRSCQILADGMCCPY